MWPIGAIEGEPPAGNEGESRDRSERGGQNAGLGTPNGTAQLWALYARSLLAGSAEGSGSWVCGDQVERSSLKARS